VPNHRQIRSTRLLPRRATLLLAGLGAGYALAALAGDSTVPWQRVVNAAGEISTRDLLGGTSQRALLEAEGVAFDAHGKIDFQRYRWTP
jgi:methylated-DNA-protein-cysteine methyltransferase-like protein